MNKARPWRVRQSLKRWLHNVRWKRVLERWNLFNKLVKSKDISMSMSNIILTLISSFSKERLASHAQADRELRPLNLMTVTVGRSRLFCWSESYISLERPNIQVKLRLIQSIMRMRFAILSFGTIYRANASLVQYGLVVGQKTFGPWHFHLDHCPQRSTIRNEQLSLWIIWQT